jgi:hypothetical protein
MSVTPLPAFVTLLDAPANQSVTNTLTPTFRFKPSNSALLARDAADGLVFNLFVMPVYTPAPLYDIAFDVDFTDIDDQGSPYVMYYDYYYGSWEPAYYEQGDDYVWFVRFENNGTICIDTDNEEFEWAAWVNRYTNDHYMLMPGAAYEWGIFGENAGILGVHINSSSDLNAMHFYKVWDSPADSSSYSYGSIYDMGFGAVNGFFTLITSVDAR